MYFGKEVNSTRSCNIALLFSAEGHKYWENADTFRLSHDLLVFVKLELTKVETKQL